MIYLDYNATTPVDERVLQEMLPWFSKHFGNAASATHAYGWLAKDAVETARKQVAGLLGGADQEIIFTSGSTESLNLAIKGVYHLYQSKGRHIVTVKTEHKAVLDTCKFLESKGAQLTYLDVDANGLVDLQQLENSITDQTVLVAVMYANNETGVIQPVADIARIVHSKKSIFCCDATQALGKLQVDVQRDGIDLLCVSAHKLYGPKGAGALYVRRRDPRVSLEPLVHGGGHERGLRSGTLNVPGIVGLGKACTITVYDDKVRTIRDHLEQNIKTLFSGQATINGENAPRLSNTSNVLFPFKAERFIHHLKNKVAVATGSACTSAENRPSHVLTAMGLSREQAESSIRFSLGKDTTRAEIDELIAYLPGIG